MKKLLTRICTFFALFAVGAAACTKTITDERANPFDHNGQDTIPGKADLSKLEGLHQQIFVLKCANPTCHDGSFEPDFRSVQSTYASLVYHPVTKNDDQGTYTYRVLPGEADSSWLFRRLIADEVLGRMPLYAEPLPQEEIDAIKEWINQGAKDIFSQTADAPNFAPVVRGYGLYNAAYQKIDTIRVDGWASAFLVPGNTSENLLLSVEDDQSDLNDFMVKELSFSYARDNWQAFQTLPLNKLWSDVLQVPFVAAQFTTDTTIYFRVKVVDGGGAETVMPNENSPLWWKENFSFKVLP